MWNDDKSQTEVASGNFSSGNFSAACGDDDDEVGNDDDDDNGGGYGDADDEGLIIPLVL